MLLRFNSISPARSILFQPREMELSGTAPECRTRYYPEGQWKQLDLNQRSFDYQSNALPTKLCFQDATGIPDYQLRREVAIGILGFEPRLFLLPKQMP